jgi:hypothetical protein
VVGFRVVGFRVVGLRVVYNPGIESYVEFVRVRVLAGGLARQDLVDAVRRVLGVAVQAAC